MKRALAATVATTVSLALASCSSDSSDPTADALERCQDTVGEYVKYPSTIQWADPDVEEEQNGIIYIAGGADANNDAGNPVPVRYSCHLDTATDEWGMPPSMEPKNPTDGRWQTSRWGGADSPMLEKYGDSMSLEQ